MAQITLTIPDEVINRVTDAFATKFGYDEEYHGTKADFTKQKLIESVMTTVKEVEASQASVSAMSQARADVENSITIS